MDRTNAIHRDEDAVRRYVDTLRGLHKDDRKQVLGFFFGASYISRQKSSQSSLRLFLPPNSSAVDSLRDGQYAPVFLVQDTSIVLDLVFATMYIADDRITTQSTWSLLDSKIEGGASASLTVDIINIEDRDRKRH